MIRPLPPSASIAHADEGLKLHAPSAARNAGALCAMLCKYAPDNGRALEIASGTGQHVTAFAKALPNLHWHPTEIDAARRASIDAYVVDANLQNVAAAAHLDATSDGWGSTSTRYDLITLANLLHLISIEECQTVIREAGLALKTDGALVLYGPFKRNGALTSDGDIQFDAELRAADPAIGYKDTLDIAAWLGDAGLTLIATETMPANNLALVARKLNV